MGASFWYVIQTRPREEEAVEERLKRKGIRTFLPRVETEQVLFGRVIRKVGPLFSGYLFAKWDLEQEIDRVRWEYGLKRIVSFNDEPARVREEVIRVIRFQANRAGIVRFRKKFRPSQAVRIIHGPMRDLEGIFIKEVSGGDRVQILLKALRFCSRIELHRSMLEQI